MSLVLAEKPEVFDRDLLYERAASHYLELLDELGKPPRLGQVIDRLLRVYSFYNRDQVDEALRDPEFDAYLQGRRKRHLIERTAAKLVAAEMGSRLGVQALAVLQERLVNEPHCLKPKDLIEIAKLGMNLNAGIDKDLTEATGDVKITMHLKDVLVGLPPERAAVLMAEYGRMMASPKAKAEIVDVSIGDQDEA